MASYNGENIFGLAVSMQTEDVERASQKNAFPGLSGTEELDQGLRGRITQVKGILTGEDPSSLDFAEALFRSYNDGNAYLLYDTLGRTWFNVKYRAFQPQGRVRSMNSPNGGVLYFRPYQAQFFHL